MIAVGCIVAGLVLFFGALLVQMRREERVQRADGTFLVSTSRAREAIAALLGLALIGWGMLVGVALLVTS